MEEVPKERNLIEGRRGKDRLKEVIRSLGKKPSFSFFTFCLTGRPPLSPSLPYSLLSYTTQNWSMKRRRGCSVVSSLTESRERGNTLSCHRPSIDNERLIIFLLSLPLIFGRSGTLEGFTLSTLFS